MVNPSINFRFRLIRSILSSTVSSCLFTAILGSTYVVAFRSSVDTVVLVSGTASTLGLQTERSSEYLPPCVVVVLFGPAQPNTPRESNSRQILFVDTFI